MELVQIIYNILLFVGTLLVCVIIISYLMSKSRIGEEVSYNSADSSLNQKSLLLQSKINYEQELFREKISAIPPQIFPIDDLKLKEVKIIRKLTVSKRDSQKGIRIEERHLDKTNGNGKRYTIVNDEVKESRSRAANFYL
ncbi:MAG: hypothetical protein NTZ27_12710 [Ignavibacteriales bacterium]|nr:hypothetical protein [Ignavibacteriales bacterium]